MQRIVFWLLCLCAALLVPGPSPAASSDPEPTDTLTIGKLRFNINDQKQLLEQSVQEERDLLAELERLNREAVDHQRKINELKKKISEQERILTAKKQETISLMRQNEALRTHLIKRLKAYYIMGRNGFLDITFSGRTLPELLLSQDAFGFLVTYDMDLFKEYRDSITDIERVTQAKILEKSMLEKFLADEAAENKGLQENAQEKNDLLRRVQAQKGLYRLALKEMRKAERELAATMRPRESSLPSRNNRGNILRVKGQLPPPLWGEVIRRFQQPGDDGDPTFANGITIETPPQSEVYAVFGGTVLFAGPMRGYGNLVIIDHHQHYYSVNARLGKIRVQQGDSIAQGRVIGITGEHSEDPEHALYFEIRRDEVAEDPLAWLSPNSLALP